MKGAISYNLNGNILFDNFEFGDSFLFFYQDVTNRRGGGRWKF